MSAITNFFKKPKAPPPMDVGKIGAQQSVQNAANVQQQQTANRPNQTNAFGSSLMWRQTGTDANGNPTYEQTQEFGEIPQAYSQGLFGLGQRFMSTAGEGAGNSMDAFNTADQNWQQLNAGWLQREKDAERNRLSNLGHQEGSEGYNAAMDALAQRHGKARNDFLLSGQNQFWNQGLQGRQQELAELAPGMQFGNAALGAGFQGVPGLNVANVDYTGLNTAAYNQQMEAYKQQVAEYNAKLGGLASIGGQVAQFALPYAFPGPKASTGTSGLGSATGGGFGQ